MADSHLTLAALLAALPLNTSKQIKPQNVRDIVETLRPRYGSCYVSTAVQTLVATVDTPLKALGTTTLGGTAKDFDMPANNRLRYTGAVSAFVVVIAFIDAVAAAAAKEFAFHLYKDGALITGSSIRHTFVTSTEQNSVVLGALTTLANNEYVELYVENKTDATDITISRMNMIGLALAL